MRSGLLLVVVVPLLAGGCQPALDPLLPVQVGVLNPLTGALGTLGPSWEDAARLAAEQVNSAGGVFGGRPLELVFTDTESSPARARSAAAELVDQGVAAVIGPASSAEAQETLDVFEAAGIPQTSCCATSVDLSNAQPPLDRWFFRTTPNDGLQGRALAHIAVNGTALFAPDLPNPVLPCAESILIHRGDSYGRSLAQVFTDAYVGRQVADLGPGSLLGTAVEYPADATTFTDVATAVQARLAARTAPSTNPLCVAVIAYAPDGLGVIAAIEPLLQGAVFSYLATDGLNDPAFASQATLAGTRVVGTAPTHAENDAYAQFDKAFRARFGQAPGNLTFTMYDAVLLTALAATSAGSTDGALIRDALFLVSRGGQRFEGRFFGEVAEALLRDQDIDYVGPSGELDFDDSGDVVGDYVVWQPALDGAAYVITERGTLAASTFAGQ